jgi:hypothetical protein
MRLVSRWMGVALFLEILLLLALSLPPSLTRPPTPLLDALHHRTVRIFTPTKSTMQSAKQGTQHWQIDWDVLPGSGRWENELMGWAST